MTEATGPLTTETDIVNKQGRSCGKIVPGNIVKVQITQTNLENTRKRQN